MRSSREEGNYRAASERGRERTKTGSVHVLGTALLCTVGTVRPLARYQVTDNTETKDRRGREKKNRRKAD